MIAFSLLRNRLAGSGILLQAFGVGLLLYQGVDRIWAIPSGLYVIYYVLLFVVSRAQRDCLERK